MEWKEIVAVIFVAVLVLLLVILFAQFAKPGAESIWIFSQKLNESGRYALE